MRIIAGTHRGRPLRAPKGMSTRPTTDRVREALFAVIGDITDCEVLDCYAGSGALGLEALSRGAKHCGFIESSKQACATIRRNIEALDLNERATLHACPVDRARPRIAGRRFDLVLSDPPWPICQTAAIDVLKLVKPLLVSDALVVLGHPTRDPLRLQVPEGFVLTDTRSWGDSAMSLWRLSGDPTTPPDEPAGSGATKPVRTKAESLDD